MRQSLLQSFRLFFVQYLALNSRVKANQPQKVTLAIMQQSCLDLHVQCCLLKVLPINEIMKISPSMIESRAVEGCFFVGCILLIFTSGVHSSKNPQPLSHITSGSNFYIKFTKIFSCMVTYFNLVLCKGFIWKQSVINHTTRSATNGTLRLHTHGALKENLWYGEICCTNLNHPYNFFISLQLQSPIFQFSSN